MSMCGCADFAIVMMSKVMSHLYRVGAHILIHTCNRIILGEINSRVFLLDLKSGSGISARCLCREQNLATADNTIYPKINSFTY